jgi:exosome complex RNA-binding protein Csl4
MITSLSLIRILAGTARPDLGVLHGIAETGETLAPESADWMTVPGTAIKERRKVAKPPSL